MTKSEPYLDAATLALLKAVAKVAAELDMAWMVTGAAGRVLLLEGVYGLPQGRATRDVDLGIMVASWDRYRALVDRLRRDDRFQPERISPIEVMEDRSTVLCRRAFPNDCGGHRQGFLMRQG